MEDFNVAKSTKWYLCSTELCVFFLQILNYLSTVLRGHSFFSCRNSLSKENSGTGGKSGEGKG